MQRFFGRSKPAPPPPTMSEASERLDKRVALLDAKIQGIDQQLVKCREEMQKARGPAADRAKQRALQLLRQKKQYESQRGALYDQSSKVDQIAYTMEQAKDTAEQVAAMKAGAKELKSAYKKMKIDDVERVNDELEDLYYDAQEVQEVLGRQYGVQDEVGDSELMAELGALGEAEDTGYLDAALAVPGSQPLPTGPSPAAPADQETDAARVEEQLGL
eukprot:TRINITY_DN34817_c0_g1_i1.p1 TRINITY_DN34817_c0_g1~~TRINITY_DN34817_c0_g1_i1.p1  ORF type:complete len:217 (-),score=40.71 TRINITY_DN34817_c0_g1_i1:125-775(-)